MFKSILSASLVAASLAVPALADSPAAKEPAVKQSANSPRLKDAKAHGKMHGRSPERLVQRLEKDLQLTPEQTVKVREILAPAAAAPEKGQGKRVSRRAPLPFGPGFAAQMRAEKVDVAALDKAWETRAARQREGFVKMRDKFVALHAVLTPEQRARLADRMERRGKAPHHKDGAQDARG